MLLGASGDALTTLMATAARVRDQGLADAGRPGIVTYSKKVFIPLTRLCRDRCHYCTFATTPGRVHSPYLSPDEVLEIARQGAALGCKEALFTLGDAPEDRWEAARQWLEEAGYDSTLDYVRAMAIRVLEETGLLPHLNPGVMSWQDLQRLKPVAPSMGMMLETTSRRLFEEKGQPHFGSPDKDPAIRLRVLEDAGRSNVPFTTGLLIGIGEIVGGAGGLDLRAAQDRPAVQRDPGSDHPGVPGEAGHGDAQRRRRTAGRVAGRDRRHPRRARAARPRAGAAEPGRPGRVPGAARRGRGRLRRGVAADAGPREPGTPMAADRRPGEGHRGCGFRLAGAVDRASGVPARAVARPATDLPRRGAGRSGDWSGQRGCSAGRPAVAGAGRRLGQRRPHRPAHRDRHRGTAYGDPLRLRRRVRRLGRPPRGRRSSVRTRACRR